MSILKLNLCNALSESYLDALNQKKITKTTDIVSKDVEDIVQLTGIPYKDVVSIRNTILAQYGYVTITGSDLYNSVVSSSAILSTGIKSIDEVLDGGVYTGEVTELVGEIAAGKTQVCLSACVCTAMEGTHNILYVDTGGSFSALKLQQIVTLKQPAAKIEDILSRINHCNAFTIYDIFTIIDTIEVSLRGSTDVFYTGLKLLILDNIASVVYPFLGGGSFADSQGLLCSLGQKIKSLATEFSLAILITNNVAKGDNNLPIASLGRVWSHVPHVRLLIGQSREDYNQSQRTVTVLKNCRGRTRQQTTFNLLESGEIV